MSVVCHAQTDPLGPASARFPFRGYDPGYITDYVELDAQEFEVLGNPYENETYQMGTVRFEGSLLTFLFRFNALRDRVELKDASNRMFHLKKNPDYHPYFGGKYYVLLRYISEDGIQKLGYFVPLNFGEVRLYFKPRKTFSQAMRPVDGYDKFHEPFIKDDSSYYLQAGEVLEPVRLRRRDLLRKLDRHPEEIRQYLRNQHPNLKSEVGALALLKYYNSLL